jgi:hypothetical protein
MILKPGAEIRFQVTGVVRYYFIAVFKLVGAEKSCPGQFL